MNPPALQWGHADHSVEDSSCIERRLDALDRLQWGHADHSVEDCRSLRSRCPLPASFNGATLITAWKTSGVFAAVGPLDEASMGPR